MIYHILNGDSLAYSFSDAKIQGEIVVAREALVSGNLEGDTLQEFWRSRAGALGISDREYQDSVVNEFQKIIKAPADSEFNLWFEYDLFCQVNMWFVIAVINSLPFSKKTFAVYTTHLDEASNQFWNGFGPANADELNTCYANKILLNKSHLQFAENLWLAYKNYDLDGLTALAATDHPAAFPYLQQVVQAHTDRFPDDGSKGRPEKAIEDITQNISTDFQQVCIEFWKRESIYGFGDNHIRKLYEEVMNNQ